MRRWLLALAVAWLANSVRHVSVYQIRTAIGGVRGLLSLPREAIDKCTAAYAFFQSQPGTTVGSFAPSNTDVETEHVRAYYTVTHHLLSIADITCPALLLPLSSQFPSGCGSCRFGMISAGLGSGGTGSTCVVVRRTSQNSVDAEVCSSTKV